MRRNATALVVILAAAAATSHHVTRVRVRATVVQAHASAARLREVTNAAAVPRAFYGKRLEPRESVVLHGAGQSDGVSFAAYTQAMGTAKPMLSMSYVDLHDDIPAYFARLRAELAKYSELIVPQIGLAMNEGDAKKHYEQEVADGADDSRLRALCAGLKSLDRPVFLRVGYEFNGPWNGYRADAYIAAFRHVSHTVRACGLDNVAIVWDWAADQELDAERAGAKANDAAQRFERFYPGDAWVDWWGINLFSTESLSSGATRAFLADAETHGFPVMIGESAPLHHSVSEGQHAVDAWFAPYFGLIRSSRGIKAFCYIDWDWSSYPQWKDWGDGRVEKDATVLKFYRAQVGSALFANARSRGETLKLLRAR